MFFQPRNCKKHSQLILHFAACRSNGGWAYAPTLQIKYQAEMVFQVRFSGSVRDNGRRADFSLFITLYGLWLRDTYLSEGYFRVPIVCLENPFAKNSPEHCEAKNFRHPARSEQRQVVLNNMKNLYCLVFVRYAVRIVPPLFSASNK